IQFFEVHAPLACVAVVAMTRDTARGKLSGTVIYETLYFTRHCSPVQASPDSFAQSIPPAVFTDPPADVAHPANMTVLHIPSHGVFINGVIYQPSGTEPHTTFLIWRG